MRNGDHVCIEVEGRPLRQVVVHGYAHSPQGDCLCHLDRTHQRIEVSELVPLDDRDLVITEAIEQATGQKGLKLVKITGVARADGSDS